jgi:hypothetical protein|tara:strand:+ start:495 stop:686 length:192 start_codon:yes stop_codon:yes gene_type:complete
MNRKMPEDDIKSQAVIILTEQAGSGIYFSVLGTGGASEIAAKMVEKTAEAMRRHGLTMTELTK